MSEVFVDRVFESIDLGSIDIELDTKGDNRVYVHRFISAQPGQGNASEAMKTIIQLADELDVVLVLFPQAESGDDYLDQGQLVEWYERLGFVKTEFYAHYERLPSPTSICRFR